MDIQRPTHPFEIFPREIWELILEEVPEHIDTENVLMAIPELEISSRSKKFSWLMGKVMPLLASNYLSTQELLTCRLASKRWKNSVDISLETHLDRVPYLSGKLGVISGDNHICYNSVPLIQPNVQTVLQSGLDAYTGSNRFPGRYLHVRIKGHNVPNSPGVTLSEAVQLLERFGSEVWYICFNCYHFSGDHESTTHHQTEFLRCLSLLPNLKSLKLEGSFSGIASGTTFTQFRGFVLPASLESVELGGVIRQDIYFLRHLLPILVNHTHVLKLGVYDTFWDIGLTQLFPSLRELCIDVRNSSLLDLDKMLAALGTCPLRKLCVKSRQPLSICKILRILATYQIEYLSFMSARMIDRSNIQDRSAPHIRHLELKVSFSDSYSFLQLMPNLEYLTFKPEIGNREPAALLQPGNVHQRIPLATCLQNFYRHQQYQPQTFNDIWVDIPNLKMLSLHGAIDGVRRRYVREDREKVFISYVRSQQPPQIEAFNAPQHLDRLLEVLRAPATPEQQQAVLQVLRSNPQLMTAFIRHREQQQNRVGHHFHVGDRYQPPPR